MPASTLTRLLLMRFPCTDRGPPPAPFVSKSRPAFVRVFDPKLSVAPAGHDDVSQILPVFVMLPDTFAVAVPEEQSPSMKSSWPAEMFPVKAAEPCHRKRPSFVPDRSRLDPRSSTW